MTSKRDAEAAIRDLIRETPTAADDQIWAALKEQGYGPVAKALIGDVRTDMGPKHTWTKERS